MKERTEEEEKKYKELQEKLKPKLTVFVKVKDRDLLNQILFVIYRIFRAFYVSVYFYFFTLLVLFVTFLVPLNETFMQEK